jgi:CubicO group peptidase (beta-lactamase class C family)
MLRGAKLRLFCQETVAGLPLSYDPGERFSYAHDNDWLLFAVEGATGMDFEAYCKQHIFEFVACPSREA